MLSVLYQYQDRTSGSVREEAMEPAYASLCFYSLVFALAELCRRAIDWLFPNNLSAKTFGYELIGTAQMCTCVYENGLIVKHYGLAAFFLTVTSLLTAASFVNRGAIISPLGSIEAVVFGRIRVNNFLMLLLAEMLGGYMAFRLARQVWYLAITHDHAILYRNFFCSIGYKVPYVQAAAYEIIGCFLIRLIISKASHSLKRYVTAVTIAAFLTFAVAFIGVPGLNPIVASARLQGCKGLSTEWFLITYWMCPIIGSLSAAFILNRRFKFA